MSYSFHPCKQCDYNCDCISLSKKMCMVCSVCRNESRIVNEEMVKTILRSPMTPEELEDARNSSVED